MLSDHLALENTKKGKSASKGMDKKREKEEKLRYFLDGNANTIV